MTEDIIARIDEAVGCQQCGKKLKEGGPSPDFCGESCQAAWRAKRAVPLGRAKEADDRAALLDADLVIVDESWLARWFGRHR